MKTITLTLDASQMAQHLKCPLSRTLQYDEGLTIVNANDRGLNMGTVMHSLLDSYYTKRTLGTEKDYTKIAKSVIEDYIKHGEWQKLVTEEDVEFIIQRFVYYTVNYTGSGRDFNVNVVNGVAGVELGFSKELYRFVNAKRELMIFIVEGRIDLLANVEMLGGQLAFVDHKTQSMEGTLYQFNPQFRTYAWATGAKYGIVNYIGFQTTGKADKWFKRDIIQFSPFIISQWEKAMIQVFYELITDKNKQNLGSCSGAFGKFPCQYVKLCETASPELRSNIIANNYIKGEKWRPW